MKKFKSKITAFVLAGFAMFAVASCEDDGYADLDPGASPTQEMNGEWFVDIYYGDELLVEHALHRTYDTGTGKDNVMYIDDQRNGWWLGGLVNVNLNDLTFSATDADNFEDPGTTFNLMNGKIMKGAATSPTGVVVDSIYFEATFSYDPESVLTFKGYGRTGFEEEE